ncbi:hypothetical protein LT493_29220 [Streptomyces tricolor]|nr:hypothetical protein [Streptomyces tricolor]
MRGPVTRQGRPRGSDEHDRRRRTGDHADRGGAGPLRHAPADARPAHGRRPARGNRPADLLPAAHPRPAHARRRRRGPLRPGGGPARAW